MSIRVWSLLGVALVLASCNRNDDDQPDVNPEVFIVEPDPRTCTQVSAGESRVVTYEITATDDSVVVQLELNHNAATPADPPLYQQALLYTLSGGSLPGVFLGADTVVVPTTAAIGQLTLTVSTGPYREWLANAGQLQAQNTACFEISASDDFTPPAIAVQSPADGQSLQRQFPIPFIATFTDNASLGDLTVALVDGPTTYELLERNLNGPENTAFVQENLLWPEAVGTGNFTLVVRCSDRASLGGATDNVSEVSLPIEAF